MTSCFNKLNSNLLKFEKYSINIKKVVQFSEPTSFWNLFSTEMEKANFQKRSLKSFQNEIKDQLKMSEIYSKNADWNTWFCYSQEKISSNVSKSSRSKQSLYSYAEENDKKNKCVLFLFPEFKDPFYFFDLDDLQNDGLALLIDPLKKVRKI